MEGQLIAFPVGARLLSGQGQGLVDKPQQGGSAPFLSSPARLGFLLATIGRVGGEAGRARLFFSRSL